MAKSKDVILADLRGGLNDSDPPTQMMPDQCTFIENVEWHCASRQEHSTLGTRRAGTTQVTTPITAGDDVVFLHNNPASTDLTGNELWAISVNAATTPTVRYKTTAWQTVTQTDTFTCNGVNEYHFAAQSLHGKLFIAGKTAQNRLHVRDAGATTIRRSGLAEPSPPTVAETGAGTFSGIRYYRVRYTVQSAGVTLRRSEPSTVTTYDPAAFGSNGLAARVTKPASIGENETHWEIEASLDNANFYRIATQVVGTTTYDDSVAFSTGYAVSGTLSEDVGDYEVLPSARFLAADDDRLLLGSSWEDEALSGRVAWTPVLNDPGSGNDERAPIDTDNFIDLDTKEGGGLTGLSKTANGYIFAFKSTAIYQLTRTGQRARAYTAHALSKKRGAIEGSIVEALDQNGKPAVYFWDPRIGPCRIGDGGIQSVGYDIRTSAARVNIGATVPSRVIYYPESHQIHWWMAVDGGSFPSVIFVLHIKESRQYDNGVRRGWTIFTGNRGAAISACMFAENIEAGVARSLIERPFIGKVDGTIHICDQGITDSGTSYVAFMTSGPVVLDPLNMFGLLSSALVHKASSGITLEINLIRNFGEEVRTFDVDLTPAGSEDPVIHALDEVVYRNLYSIQVEFSDIPGSVGTGDWNLYMFAGERAEES